MKGSRGSALMLAAAAALAGGAAWNGAAAPPRCTAPPVLAPVELYDLRAVLGDASFDAPVQALEHPALPGAWIVVLQRGVVLLVRDGETAEMLDISERVELGDECGLHGVAPAPGFPGDPRVFVAYLGVGNVSRLSVFTADARGETIDPASETELLSERQDMPSHPIAGLEIGPDGHLYVGWGEGGSGHDPSLLRGKLLRLDIGGPRPFAIPSDNPFAGTQVRAEAYATGLRNPWRFSFDRETGELWAGDVGGHAFEEIDRIAKGVHYGWPQWEGTACRDPAGCPAARAEPPVHEHTHDDMCAVIGGYVYRGRALPELRGRYVYGDNCTGTVWALEAGGGERREPAVIARARRSIASFAQDAAGELYVVETGDRRGVERGAHRLRKLVRREGAATPPQTATRAARLSETGCIARGGFREPPPGTIAYGLNHPAWEDGAETVRFAKLSPLPRVWGNDVEPLPPPPGSILLKTYALEGRPIETQVLVRRDDGDWDVHDYRWNAAGDDAFALTAAETATLPGGRSWRFPGPEGCAACHHSGVGMVRAFTVSQLNRRYEGTDQLAELEALGLLVWPWKGGVLPATPRLDDVSSPVEQRARAYLHVNCAHCHQPGGRASGAAMDLRATTPLVLTGACGRAPSAKFPQQKDVLLLAPGEPERSLLAVRAKLEGPGAMPPHRRLVDAGGVRVLEDWIRSLASCEPGAS